MKHVLVFHTDQQRYDSLGCTGNRFAVTPNIDRLAAEGTMFTRHISSNPACMPSRASFLTGMSNFGHGVNDNGVTLFRNNRNGGFFDHCHKASLDYRGKPLFEKIPTLADMLKENGYRTAAFGKLHCTPLTAKKHLGYEESQSFWEDEEAEDFNGPYYGFDRFRVIISHGEGPCGYRNGHYARWLKRNYPDVLEMVQSGKQRTGMSATDPQIYLSPLPYELHNSMWLANEVCEYLEDNRDDQKPGFVFVGFPDPHHPFTPPADFAEKFAKMATIETAPWDERIEDKPGAVSNRFMSQRSTDDDIAKAQHYTNVSVALIDKAIGKVLDKLKETGLYDDTIIVFTSDHGDYLGDYRNLYKSWCVSHDLVHVPLVIKGTGHDSLPSLVNEAVANYDVVPTLLHMLGLEIPYHIQGTDIFKGDLIKNMPISGSCTPGFQFTNFSIYDSRYRYACYPHTKEEELYDHYTDPMELNNLAVNRTEDNSEICNRMRRDLMEKHLLFDTHLYGYSGIY